MCCIIYVLKRMNLIDNYLQFFPQFRKNFFIYKKHCDEFIENLHECLFSEICLAKYE